MSPRQQLLREIEQMPDILMQEVLEFVRFIRARALRSGNELAIASEKVLARDWLKPEEDEVWRDL